MASSELRIHVLGGLRVLVGEQPVPDDAWRSQRASALVSRLALMSGHRAHREQLMDAFWPELDSDAQLNNLNVATSRARQALVAAGAPPGKYLVRHRETLALGPSDDIWIDVHAFESAVTTAWRLQTPAAFQHALSLYQGDLLPETLYDEWVEGRRTALRTSLLAVLARLGQILTGRGEIAQALATFQWLVDVEPTHEEAHVALMRLYALAGQGARALAQYELLATSLRDEVDARPEATTQDLAAAIRAGRYPVVDQPLQPDRMSAHSGVPSIRTNLPADLDELIGRRRQVAEVIQLLAVTRLVTLTGPGGIGKTRLSLQVAAEVLSDFADGIFIVDLAPIRDPALVIQAIAATLDVKETADVPLPQTLASALLDKQLLLVLDNVEQVVESAPQLRTLLVSCPSLRLLATSRVPLHIAGEREYLVPALGIPDRDRLPAFEQLSQYEAVQLFLERARAVQRDFQISDANAPAVAELCVRLDGLPLAIELAASWMRTLSPEAVLSRLDHRLALLSGGRRDVPARHQTLRHAIAWSYDLLGESERQLLRSLSVFQGGWTLGAAEAAGDAVGGTIAVVHGLDQLVQHSLVRVHEQPNGSTRYSMPEMVREFGFEQLQGSAEADAARARHAAFMATWVRMMSDNLTGGDAGETLLEMDVERHNIRAAIEWLLDEGAHPSSLQLVVDMQKYWNRRGLLRDAERWTRMALEQHPDADPILRSWAQAELAGYLWETGRYDAAGRLAEQSLVEFREANDLNGIAQCTYGLGLVAEARGDYPMTIAYVEESLAAFRAIGDVRRVIGTLNGLAVTYLVGGENEQARSLLHEARDLLAGVGGAERVSRTQMNLAWLALATQEEEEAAGHLRAALPSLLKIGDPLAIADAMAACAALAASSGRVSEAAHLHGAARKIRAEVGATDMPVIERYKWSFLVEAQRQLGNDTWQEAVIAGQHLSVDESSEIAMTLLEM